MSAKLSEKEVDKWYKRAGCRRLERYRRSDVGMLTECLVCGYKKDWRPLPGDVIAAGRKGRRYRCPKCKAQETGERKRLADKEVDKWYKKAECKRLGRYVGAGTRVLTQCRCGHKWPARPGDVITAGRKGRRYRCRRCVARENSQRKTKDLTGKQFGYLVVLERTNRRKTYGGRTVLLWKARCTRCGRIVYRNNGRLRHLQSCGCLSRRTGAEHPGSKFAGQVPGSIFAFWRAQAKEVKKVVRISNKELADLYEQQEGKCALTGIELSFGSSLANGERLASIDRIDSTERVYRPGNVQWVHKTVQKIKGRLSVDRFICFCQLTTRPIRSTKQSPGCTVTKKHPNFKGMGNIGRTFWRHSLWAWEQMEKNKGLPRCRRITIKQGWEKFIRQNGRCARTGLELDFLQATGHTRALPSGSRKSIPHRGSASLDRIDSSVGHTNENTRWVHKAIQWMKWELDESEFRKWCKLVAKHCPKSTAEAARSILEEDRKDLPNIKRICEFCGKEFENFIPWTRFCSVRCRSAFKYYHSGAGD